MAKMNNYMIVTTLILGVAGGFIIEGSLDDAANHIEDAYYVCLGNSIVFLTLSIMFSVQASGAAYENSVNLLTVDVRPEGCVDDTHDYLQETQQFEKSHPTAMLRVPVVFGYWSRLRGGQEPNVTGRKEREQQKRQCTVSGLAPETSLKDIFALLKEDVQVWKEKCTLEEDEATLEFVSPEDVQLAIDSINEACTERRKKGDVESPMLRVSATGATDPWSQEAHLLLFGYKRHIWQSYEEYAQRCMAHGLICLCHSCAYFTYGKLYHGTNIFIAVLFGSIMVFLSVVLFQNNFQWTYFDSLATFMSRLGTFALVAGPLTNWTAAWMGEGTWGNYVLVVLAACFHCSYWLLMTRRAQKHQAELDCDNILAQERARNHKDKELLRKADEILNVAIANRNAVVKIVIRVLNISALFWVFVIGWAMWRVWSVPPSHTMALEEVNVAWENVHFAPRHVACTSSKTLVANDFSIVQLQSTKSSTQLRSAVPYPCELTSQIVDLTIACNESSTECEALVLPHGESSQVARCPNGTVEQLLQAVEPATLIAARGKSFLYALHGSRIIEYAWSSRLKAWAPEGVVAVFPASGSDGGSVRGLDVVGESLLVFYGNGKIERHALTRTSVQQVESIDLGNGFTMNSGCMTSSTVYDVNVYAMLTDVKNLRAQRGSRLMKSMRLTSP
eukprot:TRINITY_DN22859_c0_g2_i1.p1 TRINITY_DN22859_c0_g2~~TRINITY_DN22859_c0_g2_i1.p1  ORF type:complete len:752 (-),score=80.31 TRINITY_DN22859_c0_g2_i1:45-2066(-)